MNKEQENEIVEEISKLKKSLSNVRYNLQQVFMNALEVDRALENSLNWLEVIKKDIKEEKDGY